MMRLPLAVLRYTALAIAAGAVLVTTACGAGTTGASDQPGTASQRGGSLLTVNVPATQKVTPIGGTECKIVFGGTLTRINDEDLAAAGVVGAFQLPRDPHPLPPGSVQVIYELPLKVAIPTRPENGATQGSVLVAPNETRPEGAQDIALRSGMCPADDGEGHKTVFPIANNDLNRMQVQYRTKRDRYDSQRADVAKLVDPWGRLLKKPEKVSGRPVVGSALVMNLVPVNGFGFWSTCNVPKTGTFERAGLAGGKTLFHFTTTAKRTAGDCPSGTLIADFNQYKEEDLSFLY